MLLKSKKANHNIMFLLKRDGFIYLLNAAVFVFIFRSDIKFYNGWLIAITILLIISAVLFKQRYSNRNTFTLGSRRNNSWGIILSFLFLFNLVLLWEEFVLMEIVYVIVFSLVQIFETRIKEENSPLEGR